jgi:hypothetical protein
MRNWNKRKVFFLLILLIGTGFHFLVNISYFMLHKEQFIKDYSNMLFLPSLVFVVFSTFVFCTKISGFFNRFLGATAILLFQGVSFILTIIPFVLLDGFFEFMTPEFIQGDQKFAQTIETRFADKYGIVLGDAKVISHSSYWRVGEEFGYDLIISLKGGVARGYTPKGSEFSLLRNNIDNTPFRFTNLEFICKNTMGSDLKISDDKVFDLLCSDKEFPIDTLIAEKIVRADWTVTSVFFPSQKILWITETEW